MRLMNNIKKIARKETSATRILFTFDYFICMRTQPGPWLSSSRLGWLRKAFSDMVGDRDQLVLSSVVGIGVLSTCRAPSQRDEIRVADQMMATPRGWLGFTVEIITILRQPATSAAKHG